MIQKIKNQVPIDKYLDALESAGVEFAPEEKPSAVEEWEKEKNRLYGNDYAGAFAGYERAGDSMRDELLAENKRLREENEGYPGIAHDMLAKDAEIEQLREEVERLKGNWKINCDMMETRNEIIKKQKAEIERLKQPIPESPELAKFRDEYYAYDAKGLSYEDRANRSRYIRALESEISRLRQRIGVLESGRVRYTRGGDRLTVDSNKEETK